MKPGFFLTFAFAVFAGSASAQKIESTRVLKQEEVPIAIQQSLQKDFNNLTEKGKWRLMYNENVDTHKLTPEFYTYSCKNNGEKIEIFYKPDGALDHVKGLAAPAHGAQP